MKYTITKYTRQKAGEMGVTVKQSSVAGKKIDVFDKDGVKLASIGALGMNDYPTWKKKMGKRFADARRKAYKSRHEKDRHIKGSPGYYADKLLW